MRQRTPEPEARILAELLSIVLPDSESTRSYPAEELVSLARRHRVTGELQTHARRSNDEALLERLALAETTRRRELLGNALAVKAVSNVLDGAGVPHVYLKGLGLATLARSDPQDRSTNDVDVLVEPRQLRIAADALIEAGAVMDPHYPRLDSSWASRAFQGLRAEATLHFVGQAIDLHWHTGPDPAVYPPSAEAIRRDIEVEVFGVQFRTLSPADALWQGALHFRDDGFRQLRHALDVVALCRTAPARELPRASRQVISCLRSLAEDPTRLASGEAPDGVPVRQWRWLRAGLLSDPDERAWRLRTRSAVAQVVRPTSRHVAVRTPARLAIGPIARIAGGRSGHGD